jgi:ribosome maturation factor RimP
MNQSVPGSYQLEVSSPGIERPLRTLESFQRFQGSRVLLTTHEAHDGQRNFEGQVLGRDGTRAGFRTDDGVEHWFDWAEVKTARLVVDPWARARGQREPGSKLEARDREPGSAGGRRWREGNE